MPRHLKGVLRALFSRKGSSSVPSPTTGNAPTTSYQPEAAVVSVPPPDTTRAPLTLTVVAPQGLDSEGSELYGRRQALNFSSTLVAAERCQIRCRTHEWCNATCTDARPALEYTPLLSPSRGVLTIEPPPSVSFPETAIPPPPITIATLDPFIYDPLPNPEMDIRLVQVRPAVSLSEPVSIELVPVRLGRSLKYAALSYVWGPAVFDHEIACNGKKLAVTKILYESLKRHRQHQHSEPYLLWTDAICINQADPTELNSQIAIMNFIYMFASVVYVDFGNAEPSWFSGLDVMMKLKTLEEVDCPPDVRPDDLPKYGLPHVGHEAWASFLSIWLLPWFRRTWIVQEVVLASSIVCRFGRFTFPWDHLVAAFRTLTRLGRIRNLLAIAAFGSSTASRFMMGVVNYLRIDELRTRFKRSTLQSPDRLEPINVLYMLREFHVSNPKDKIVAILGMLLPPSASAASFHYDYSWSFDKLYHHFAAWLAWDARPLWGSYERNRMLSHAGLERRVPGSATESAALPTWVPDWRAQSIEQYAKPLSTIRKVPYRAVSRSRGSVMFLLTPDNNNNAGEEPAREILVSGCLVDTISAITDVCAASGHGSSPSSADDEEEDKAIQDIGEWHTTAFTLCENRALLVWQDLVYDDWEDAFSRTLLGNDVYSGGHHAMDAFAPIEDPKATRRELAGNHATWEVESLVKAHRSAVATYLEQMTACCRKRRFAVGEKGCMGLVPNVAAVGDHVFLISGCTVPFVLRRVQGGGGPTISGADSPYALVGECYIHGIMDGEPVESLGIITASWTAARIV